MNNVFAFVLMLLFVFDLIGTEVMMVDGKPLLTLYKTSRQLAENCILKILGFSKMPFSNISQ